MKKVTFLFLALVMLLTPFNTVFAQTSNVTTPQPDSIDVLAAEKENFHFIEGSPGDRHLVYTYESNGKTYKVEENASENFEEVNSTIYVHDKKGEFIELATQNLIIEDSKITQTTDMGGEVTVESQDISLMESESTDEEGVVLPSRMEIMINATCYGEPVGGWGLVGTNRGSTKITNYSVTGVTAAIIYAATASTTKIAKGSLAAAAGAIAMKIIDERLPTVYYTRTYYERKLRNPGRGLGNFIVASNWYTNWYKSSSRTSSSFIRATDAYTYHSCFKS